MANTNTETCIVCSSYLKHIESPDILESQLAHSCYTIHLKKDHGLSSFEVLKLTGVWVEL